MDKNQSANCPKNCLVCGTSKPEKEWVDETYHAQPCRFCSPHCQAKFEDSPQNYVANSDFLRRPLGYS